MLNSEQVHVDLCACVSTHLHTGLVCMHICVHVSAVVRHGYYIWASVQMCLFLYTPGWALVTLCCQYTYVCVCVCV